MDIVRKDISEILDYIQLVSLSKGFKLDEFHSEIEEYSKFLYEDALEIQDRGITKVHLIIDKRNANIIGYLTLSADFIKLSDAERQEYQISNIPFSPIPAIKIGMLAIDKRYSKEYKGIGRLLIQIARGFAQEIIEKGVACRFITVDADTIHNETVHLFYVKNGFKYNEAYSKKKKVSMRLDIFDDI